MDVKRMSKNFVSKIQQNLRPLAKNNSSNRVVKANSELKNSVDLASNIKKLDIESTYKTIRQNMSLDNKSMINIITCLKAAQKCWEEYLRNPNKTGQLACTYEIKMKRIQNRYNEQLGRPIVQGSIQKVKQCSEIMVPIIQLLQTRSKKYKQHQSQLKIISRKMQQPQASKQQQQDQIKQQMLDLVDKFKKYAINIQQNLHSDTKIIKQIGDSQDKQLASLSSKNVSMEQIVKEQKLGFFKLISMGVIGVVVWLFCLMIIIIV